MQSFLKKYSTPNSFNKKGKAVAYKDARFCVSIDGNEVKGCISMYFIEIASLKVSSLGCGISTIYNSTLQDIDIQILRNVGISVDGSVKGKCFEYSSWPAPIVTQRLIKYIFDRIEAKGFRYLPDEKKGFLESLCKISKTLAQTKNQTSVWFFFLPQYNRGHKLFFKMHRMANLFHDLKLGNDDLNEVNAIIEIPKDSMVKYEFDKELGCIMVDRIGRTPIPYNFNYGLLPQTWNKDDNDPLDIIVLSRFGFAPGVVVPSRVVGGLKMIDGGEFDYKVIAVADDKYYDDVNDIGDISEKEKEDIYYFMNRYKDLHNKTVQLEGWDNRESAIKVLQDCKDYYPVKFKK